MLQFAQSPWFRDYIKLNTQFRMRAKNDFEKNLYKLMNNAVLFGKIMENVRNHVELICKINNKMGRTVRREGNDRETEFSQQRLCGKFDRLRNAQTRSEVKPIYVHMTNIRHIRNLFV